MIFKATSPFKEVRTIENIWGLDSEDDSKGTCTMAGVYNGANFLMYESFDIIKLIRFFEMLHLTKEKHYFFSNNMLYDLVNIFGYTNLIDKLNSKDFEFIIAKYRFIGAVYKKNIIFLDLQNYYSGMNLKSIGKIIGLEKLEFNPEDIEYMQRDIEISYLAGKHLVDFLVENDYDFAWTVSGIALKVFMRHFLKTSFNPMTEKDLDLLRTGYKGGRCEMYFRGERSPVHVYDVNSLYPYIMKTTNIFNPASIRPSQKITPMGVYRVKIKAKDTWLPLLPEENGSIYPIGDFWTIAFGKDLIEFKDDIQINEINWGFEFDEAGYIFKNYCINIYRKRKLSTDRFGNLFYKLLLNSLYGKFGQSKYKIKWKPEIIGQNKGCFEEVDDGYNYFSFVIWSMQITAGARSYMFRNMRKVLHAKSNSDIYYTDTDSLHLSKELSKSLMSDKIMGKFKHEGSFDNANYFREKEYYLGNFENWACKGVKGYNKEMSIKEKEKVLINVKEYFKTGFTEIDSPIKFKEAIIQNKQPNVWIKKPKSRLLSAPKRIIYNSGDTFPLTFTV